MPFASVTRLRVRHWSYLPIFVVQAVRSARQAAASEGNMAVRVVRDRRNTFWTVTMWKTAEEMKGFMVAGVHGRVMRKLLDWCDEAALAHWMQDSMDVLPWAELHSRLLKEGRRSKVNHPSSAHVAFEFPEPQIGRGSELRFK